MKDTDDCEVMNELFDSGVEFKMIAQIYVKNQEEYTSVVVSNDKGTIYFEDVLNTPEITGIQRGASFVKHQLYADKTEIYPDKLKQDEILNDAYIQYCKINAEIGHNPNKDTTERCLQNMQIHQRWNLSNLQKERER